MKNFFLNFFFKNFATKLSLKANNLRYEFCGLFSSQKDAGGYKKAWMTSVCSAVAENQVRYICGVFRRGKGETEKLFRDLGVREGGLFFQPFWTEDDDDELTDETWTQSRPDLRWCPIM